MQVCVHVTVFTLLSPPPPQPTYPANTQTFFPRKFLCVHGPVSNGSTLTESRRWCIKKSEKHPKRSYKFGSVIFLRVLIVCSTLLLLTSQQFVSQSHTQNNYLSFCLSLFSFSVITTKV